MVETAAQRRLLLVHAHPDDETIGTGATMARYVASGAHVTLVTCTKGEQGEVLVPELAHLAADRDDSLGDHRVKELDAAMAELGVTDYRFLGGAGRYRDSGMVWSDDGRRAGTPESIRPDSFWAADLLDAAGHLVSVMREVRPQVVVTYDENGGYGHPDHIQAHRVATYAMALAAAPGYRPALGPAWQVRKMYWTATPRSVMQRAIERMRDAPDNPFAHVESADEMGFVLDDRYVTTAIDGTAWMSQKAAAMRAYPTQIDVSGPFFALSDNVSHELWGTEYFQLVHGSTGPVDPATGLETDLFAGLEH
ncbi:N-acetyl-1-D-myo-inositol-2-amino-2-deoxy-alpha-D-glucopyranoside deacetylase [Phytoactinopolyspora limicola]|uniref:N-acetyl-1-D-myo-inositol-2-amino-2-deoxy-alpha- D-glucopyranoside deacetylase n=1 Tax=Phytoactinopolyspora limicola TaxID=2715536 RepID=UPI001409C2E9|nr:N-acetyl-1-D-myo-inositol-2-amino-2-deoxy-alpha-D-glucopyranoside deacetylase [Phytoactinopolyspora limicola]